MRMRYAALAATFALVAVIAATLLLTSNAAPQPTSTVQQTAPHSPRDPPDTPVTPQPPDRCTTPTDPTCILAVYKGAPDDYAQVQDIPDSVLIHPEADGRYQVERGQQITVVTAAPLPTGYTRFYLQRQPLQVSVSPTSFEQLIQPVGTTYTFTVTANEAGSNLITFNLTEARPRPLPRPGQKPELGDVVVTTNFLVPTLRYDTLDITGAATTPGSYAFLKTAGDASSAIGNFSDSSLRSVELRVHPTDASGASRADFYDMVQVGDMFEYHTDNGGVCMVRFKVTSIGMNTSPRTFGIGTGRPVQDMVSAVRRRSRRPPERGICMARAPRHCWCRRSARVAQRRACRSGNLSNRQLLALGDRRSCWHDDRIPRGRYQRTGREPAQPTREHSGTRRRRYGLRAPHRSVETGIRAKSTSSGRIRALCSTSSSRRSRRQ